MACGWIKEIDFVLHDLLEIDLLRLYLKNFDINENSFEFKGYHKSIDVGLMINNIIDVNIKPSNVDPITLVDLTPWRKFKAEENYDYLVFCQSPNYTSKSTD